MKTFFHLFRALFFVAFAASLQAAPPETLNYAGRILVDGQPYDGAGQFKFALVSADGNQTYWSNDGTSSGGSEPQTAVGAQVNGGLYSLLLGNTAIPNMDALAIGGSFTARTRTTTPSISGPSWSSMVPIWLFNVLTYH